MSQRFITKQVNDGMWEVYLISKSEPQGILVSVVFDKAVLELFLQAPAMRDMMDTIKRKYPGEAKALRKRTYAEDTLDRFQEAMAGILRKL